MRPAKRTVGQGSEANQHTAESTPCQNLGSGSVPNEGGEPFVEFVPAFVKYFSNCFFLFLGRVGVIKEAKQFLNVFLESVIFCVNHVVESLALVGAKLQAMKGVAHGKH